MKRIGILGGTFNPVHIGHLAIAQVALEKLELEKVVFVPSYLPPHKSSRNVLPAEERYNMVKLAIEGYEHFEVSGFEIKREGKSYSIDTLNYFHDKYKNRAKLFFIMGEDLFKTLDTWKKIDDIKKIVTFVVVNRPGSKLVSSKVKVRFITMPGLDVSSSYIRKSMLMGKNIKYLVPEKVEEYMEKNKLFIKSKNL